MPDIFVDPESPEELFKLLERFIAWRKEHPDDKLVIWGRTTTDRELSTFVTASDRMTASVELFNQRIDLWS